MQHFLSTGRGRTLPPARSDCDRGLRGSHHCCYLGPWFRRAARGALWSDGLTEGVAFGRERGDGKSDFDSDNQDRRPDRTTKNRFFRRRRQAPLASVRARVWMWGEKWLFRTARKGGVTGSGGQGLMIKP